MSKSTLSRISRKSYLITHGPKPYIRFIFDCAGNRPNLCFVVQRQHDAHRRQWVASSMYGNSVACETEAQALLVACRSIRDSRHQDPERFDGMS